MNIKKINQKMDLDKIYSGVYFSARGGGIRSCVSIGVLKALEEAKIPVKGVSGESLSSLFAALLATGYNSTDMIRLFLKYNDRITKASKLYHGEGSIVIEEIINELTNNIKFKDLNFDCYINACHGKLLNPGLLLFSKTTTPDKTLGTACRASASLPLVFGNYKVKIDGIEYDSFDGGLLYNPFVPDKVKTSGIPILYASFHNTIDYYKIIPYLKKIIDLAESQSDAVVYAPVGKVFVTGSNDDMLKAYESGYNTAKKLLRIK